MAKNQQYDHIHTEKKWQKNWESRNAFRAGDRGKPKYYILDMFPYPSGAGLHVGHPEGYTATDIISRYKRMRGFDVLHPMGWDAFGLPAENYAIKTNVAPEKSTRNNIKTFRGQITSLGFSYDWEREIATCDQKYYKWTQWFFLLLFNNGLAYKKEAPVNWCDDCKTVLANEQVIDGHCDRCKNEVLKKKLAQWFFRITDFMEDYVNPTTGRTTKGLINGLDSIDWPESTKTSQLNWIGKSDGMLFTAPIKDTDLELQTFSAHFEAFCADTFVVIAPDHPFLEELLEGIENKDEILAFCDELLKERIERGFDEEKEPKGIFTGRYIIDPVGNGDLPIWVASFALAEYGTGIVKCSAHDERDFAFAKKYDIKLKPILFPEDPEEAEKVKNLEYCYTDMDKGVLSEPEAFAGKRGEGLREEIKDYLETHKLATRKDSYKLRDWLISRQRYWGAPIPIVYDPAGKAHAMKESELPLVLPTDVDYKPKGTSPLGSSKEYKKRAEKMYGEGFEFEIDTMDTFVCSSWYFWRFMDPNNEKIFTGSEALKKWGQVDLYVGGAEHTVLHLLYARFFCKVLHKLGYIDYDEPFYKLRHQGMILGEDGEKMSKSRGNVINPNEIVEQYGADTLRMYEMFMGPFKDMKPWNTNGTTGIYRFLQKVWKLGMEVKKNGFSDEDICEKLRHKTIKKVTDDTEGFKFNTAVSQMMVYVNELTSNGATREDIKTLLLVLGIYAPHICAELWNQLGFEEQIGHLDEQNWPEFEDSLCVDDEIEFAVQVNGKVRGTFVGPKDLGKEEVLAQARKIENVAKFLNEGVLIKEIYVPGKLINFVVKN